MSYNADGNKGERAAERFLRKKGYIFISRNYWADCGELDLVFYKNLSLIFVEVKTRKESIYGTGREAVDHHKQKCIIETSKVFIRSHCKKNFAPHYIGKIRLGLKFIKTRYDVIEVLYNSEFDNYVVKEHLKNYFN